MTADEFNRLRHIAWDYHELTGWEQSFCVCDNPYTHRTHQMDPTGQLAADLLIAENHAKEKTP